MKARRILGLGIIAVLSLVVLCIPGSTRFARPFFYRLFLALPARHSDPVTRVVTTTPENLPAVLQELTTAQPKLIALDPALWQGRGDEVQNLLALLRGIPVVLGWAADSAGPGIAVSEPAAPMPRLSTLEGALAMSLPVIHLRAGEAPPARFGNVSAGWEVEPKGPINSLQALARQGDAIVPSAGLETLRRSAEVFPDRIAYVDGIGLFIGKDLTLPLTARGKVLLRLRSAAPIPAGVLPQNLEAMAGKIILVGSPQHVVATAAGPRLAVETWASLVDDALAHETLALPAGAPWVAAGVGAAGILAVELAFFFGMEAGGLAALAGGLSLLYPLLSLGFFLGANWWLPPDKPFFTLLAAGAAAALFAVGRGRADAPVRPEPPRPIRTPLPKTPLAASSAGSPSRPHVHAPRLGEKPPSAESGLERDAQGQLTRLGRYRIVRKMSSGSSGDVFEGLDTHMARRVAVKTMARGASLHFDHALERFQVEAKAAGSLNHPNINTVHDFGTLGDVSYMVLEYLDGVTLSQWMRSHPIPPPPAVQEWVRQIAAALDYAHAHHVIHRDLKPSNLMVVDEGKTVKLLDFGVAKVEDVMLTQTGMTVGTPSYMSPEQLQGEKVTAASDQYSLAVVLYQLYSHRLPYGGSRIPEICGHILKGEFIPLHEANPVLDPAYWEVFLRALRRDPAERFPDCRALGDELEGVRAHSAP